MGNAGESLHSNRMSRPDSQLAVRSPATVVFKPASHETQYVVAPTLLGDAVLQWSAIWLAGMFCVNGFPPEVVAYVQQLLGPYRVGRWPEFEARPEEVGPFVPVEGPGLVSINGRLLPGGAEERGR